MIVGYVHDVYGVSFPDKGQVYNIYTRACTDPCIQSVHSLRAYWHAES